MKIHGLQKMTLLDYPGHVACTVFLGACDFRCPFCHNWELIDGTVPAEMEEDEFLHFLEKRKGLLEGVAITGGEPTLHPDLPDLIRKIRKLEYPVKLDTNGNHPEMLEELLHDRLVNYVAMDIKNDKARYGKTIGLEAFDLTAVERSAALLMQSDTEYEFRTTVVRELHDADSFRGIGAWIRGAKRYYLQPFVDRDTVHFAGLTAPSVEELHKFLEIIRAYVPFADIRGAE